MRASTTLIVSGPVVVTGDVLACDEGDYDAVVLASPDNTKQVMLAGPPQDLRLTLRAALLALDAALS